MAGITQSKPHGYNDEAERIRWRKDLTKGCQSILFPFPIPLFSFPIAICNVCRSSSSNSSFQSRVERQQQQQQQLADSRPKGTRGTQKMQLRFSNAASLKKSGRNVSVTMRSTAIHSDPQQSTAIQCDAMTASKNKECGDYDDDNSDWSTDKYAIQLYDVDYSKKREIVNKYRNTIVYSWDTLLYIWYYQL